MNAELKTLLYSLANINTHRINDEGEVLLGAGTAAYFKETAEKLLNGATTTELDCIFGR